MMCDARYAGVPPAPAASIDIGILILKNTGCTRATVPLSLSSLFRDLAR